LKGECHIEDLSDENSSVRSQGTNSFSSGTTNSGSVNQNATDAQHSELEASTAAINSNNASNPVLHPVVLTPKDSNPLQGEMELLYEEDWMEPLIEVSEMTKQEKMIELIKRVCGKRIDEVYGNNILFYLFLRTCVMSVIFKTKWRAYSDKKLYYEFVTVQDEAFAFLALENNGFRYLDMLNIQKEKKNYIQPKYTIVNGINKKTHRGWSLDGRIRFMELIEEVEKRRGNNSKVTNLANYVLNECREKRFTRKIDEESDKNMTPEDSEKERRWKQFLKDSSVKRYSFNNKTTG